MAAQAAVESGTGRVRLSFRPEGREVRVPAGSTVFDAACWNGIAIDSTCGGHGTCRKCKVRVAAGGSRSTRSTRARSAPDELRDGWRLACRAAAVEDLEIDVPPLQTRPKAALVGVGRHVILRPSFRSGTSSSRSRRSRIRRRISSASSAPSTTSRSRSTRPPRGRSAGLVREVELRRDRRRLRRARDRRRAGRHDRHAATRSRSTWARRPSSRRSSISTRANRSRYARC